MKDNINIKGTESSPSQRMSSTRLRCGWCSKSGAHCLVCSRCKVASYCSKACQATAWHAKHKRECVVVVPAATVSSAFLAAAAGTGDGAAGAAAAIISIVDAAAGPGDRGASADNAAAAGVQLQLTLRMQTFALERDWEGVLSIESEVMTPMTPVYTSVIAATHYWILGNAHHFSGNWVKAIWYYEKHMVVATDLDDREALCMAYGNIGMVYNKLGEYRKAVQYTQQAMDLAKQLEKMSEQVRAYGNLAVSYEKQGDFVQSIGFNEQYLELCRHEGDLDSLNRAYNSLGTCHLHLHEYRKAVTYFEKNYAYGLSVDNGYKQAMAALYLGIALMLEARAIRHGFEAVAEQDSHVFGSGGRKFGSARRFNEEPKYASPGPKFGGSGEVGAPSSERLDEIVDAASGWLANAFECCAPAQRHMAQLAFEAGHAETALEHLKGYLTLSVEDARDGCEGCGQPRCEDVAMLTCSGCRVVRFCSVDHQKMASKKASLGGCLWKGRHRDICGVLGLWRNVIRLENINPIAYSGAQGWYDRELLAFLEAGRVRCAHPNGESG
jgi:tetratricopeptide (TPR) repeat protein